jgi:orotidine-5'-phosphate decarboxylase
MAEVIVALDTASPEEALRTTEALGDHADFYKVGLELYTRAGPSVVSELLARDKRVFLDLKLHDIPNTVAGAVAAASQLGVHLLTVHAVGGSAMLEAAREAAGGRLRIVGVTVLTSLTAEDLSVVWGREVRAVPDEAMRLAALARRAGLDGVVASASDAGRIRREVGADFLLVVPGIRPSGSATDDQRRIATPAEAVKAGADYLVLGRVVTRAHDPAAALGAVLDEVAAAAPPP